MADLTKPTTAGGGTIDLAQPEARQRWSREFGVTEQELEDAVKKAGDSVERVREFLQAKNQSDG